VWRVAVVGWGRSHRHQFVAAGSKVVEFVMVARVELQATSRGGSKGGYFIKGLSILFKLVLIQDSEVHFKCKNA